MKLLIGLTLFATLTSAHSKEITLTGLQAKSVIDTLTSNEKLRVFQDAAMGVRMLSMKDVSCLKNTAPEKEMIACSFHDDSTEVKLYSDVDSGMEEIRYVLVEAALSERQTTDTMKELFIKKLDCKVSGLGHVLDDNAVELKYKCTIDI